MSVSSDVTGVLPHALQARVLALVTEMYDLVKSQATSAAQAEEQVHALSRQLAQEVLSQALSEAYGRHTGAPRPCPCGQGQRLVGYRERGLTSLLGQLRYRRAYYRCAACTAHSYAGEEALGLDGSSFTLPAQEAVSLLACEVPFERVRELLRRLCGLQVASSHAQHLTGQHGSELLEERHSECRALFAGTQEYIPGQRGHRLYVTLDATKTRFTDAWHETRVGAVYDAKAGEDGLDEPERTTYVTAAAPGSGVEQFGQVLYQEAARRGIDHAKETVVVADGAPWIWNLAAEHFPHATQILDFYHASERLHGVSRAVYGDGTMQAKQWAERSVERLEKGDWKGLLCSLKGLRPKSREGKEAVRLAVGYFATNRQRMDYPAYRHRGMHIGSGVVEAACKHVVGARCKRAGMRWTVDGIEATLALRTQLLNDRWDEYWQPLKAAA
jgi:hypothetical protein